MLRKSLLAACLLAFAFSVGCESEKANPNKLDYGKDPPPKREGPPKGK